MMLEEDYLQLNGIQHFRFCKRQWALINIENQWIDNEDTMIGNYVHEKVDDPFIREKRKEKLIVRAMPIISHELKLIGIADIVEFLENTRGISVYGSESKYTPHVVEYKKGKSKYSDIDIVQLVAQVMCLEEMFNTKFDKSSLYYKTTNRRDTIEITDEYRNLVKELANEMLELFASGLTPRAEYSKKCERCSLNMICNPKIMRKSDVKKYLERFIENNETTT